MAISRGAATFVLLLPALLVAALAPRPALAEEPFVVLEAAQFLPGRSGSPPPDDAPWQPVRLPDNWHLSRPGNAAVGWYRLELDLPAAGSGERNYAIYLPRNSARHIRFVLNGERASGNAAYGDPGARNWAPPLMLRLPSLDLSPGHNVLHVRVEAVPELRQGLTRVIVGPSVAVRPLFERHQLLQVTALLMFGAAALLAGLLAAAFWLRSRKDSTLAWYAVTALAWAAAAAPWAYGAFAPSQFSHGWLAFVARFAYAAPMVVLCLRVANKRSPWAEGALWLFTLLGLVLSALIGEEKQGFIITAWSWVYLAAPLVPLALLVRTPLAQTWVHRMFACAIVAVVLLNAHDLGRWMGWIDYDSLTLAHFHIPLMLVAIAAAIIDRYLRALADVEHANVELERRVVEKTREIEASFRRVQEAEQERALAQQRKRIMADMHDGLGSTLVGLLGAVQSGKPTPEEIERRLLDALQELRLVVDALEPVDDDLGVVLGNVRHRMRSAIEHSGVKFNWQVGELPHVSYLTPHAILAVQRIILEALTNSLRHSQASTVTVSAQAEDGWLRIQVADDGIGFKELYSSRGRGLDNLRRRAAGLGGTLDIESARGAGASVILRLPLAHEASEPAAPAFRASATLR
jgi:signal transduction histidine kinase